MAVRLDSGLASGLARALPRIEGTEASPSATDARRDSLQRLMQIAIGKQLTGQILSALNDGSHLVRVADTTVRMSLPAGMRAGESLPLTFLAREPRPTFLLDTRDASAPASLSATGRLIGQLLQTAQQEGASATALSSAAPLLELENPTAAPLDARQVAGALKQAVSESGLFYESHLREWVGGQRSLEQIRQEPQARLASPPLDMKESGNAAASAHPAAASRPAIVDADLLMPGQSAPPAVEPQTAVLVSQQLHTLEHQQVRWQGELMPGQPMEWEISRDTPEGGQPASAAEPVWTSTVRFELPTLGAVAGTLRLIDGHVQIQLSAASDEAAAAIRAHGARLAAALDAAGSPLDALMVKRDDGA